MIPYVDLSGLSLGPVRIHPFGLLLTIAVIVGHSVLVRRAKKLALADPWTVELFAIMTVGAGLVGAYLEGALLGRIAGLAQSLGGSSALARLGVSSLGGFAGGLVSGAAFVRARGLDARRFADLGAYAFPFAWFFARMGCAAAHDHLGRRSSSFLAVRFPSGPRLDMGLLEWMLTPILIAAVVVVSRRTERPGAIAAAVAIGYPLIRFPLDFLRAEDLASSDPRWLGLTAAQWQCVPLFALGCFALARVISAPREAP